MEFDVKTEFPDLLKRLSDKYAEYEYLLEDDFIEVIEFSVYHYLRLSNDPTITSFKSMARSWIKRACIEALDRITKLGVTGGIKQYSENGYQFTLDGVEISTALASEIIPRVGYPR